MRISEHAGKSTPRSVSFVENIGAVRVEPPMSDNVALGSMTRPVPFTTRSSEALVEFSTYHVFPSIVFAPFDSTDEPDVARDEKSTVYTVDHPPPAIPVTPGEPCAP